MTQTLTTRQLNRAILARQHLLERTTMPAIAMVEHLVGMQAQVPQHPYVALWSRLDGFEARELEALVEGRTAVRLPLLRTTLHLVSAADALAIRPVVQPVLERGFWTGSPFGRGLRGADVDEVVAAGRALVEERPRTSAQLAALLGPRWPDSDPAALSQAVRYLLPVVQVTPRGLWSRSGRAAWTTLEGWLGRALDPAPDVESADVEPPDVGRLVLRYLAAFGPASVRDVATWSWLTGVRPIVERLRPQLRVFRDERGVELFDLPDAPRPDPDVPAPPRLLPEYDNLGLSHADRSRVVPPALRNRFTGFAGTFLVDGFLAGEWTTPKADGRTTVLLEPYGPLASADRVALVEEAERLLGFVAQGAGGEVRFAA